MTAYLDQHPPARSQWYIRRNRPLTGCTVIHTAESMLDEMSTDSGAEAVADFIRRRDTPGSYHDLCDSDSAIYLIDYAHGAFHDGTGSNNWALSLSFACRTSDWRAMSAERRRAYLRRGAEAFARQQAWRKVNGYPLTELRLISKAQSDAGMSGFTYHGFRDPGRRSDPGVAAPNLFPFDEFIAECRAVLAGDPEEDEMAEIPKEQMDELKRHINQTYANGVAYLEKGVITRLGQNQAATMGAVGSLAGQVAGLAEALSQLNVGDGVIDGAAIQAAAEQAAERAIAKLGEAITNTPAA